MNVTQPVSANRETLLTGRETSDTSIRNIGANVVYLNDMTDVTPNAFPLYPGDVATWAKGEACYAVCPAGGIVVLSDKLANTLGLGTVSATLPAGTSVAINNTVTVGISGTGNSVQVANSPNVGILGTPNVAVTGTPNVSVTNTPTVGISGALNSVQVSNSPTVGISGTPSVNLASGAPNKTASGTLNSALTPVMVDVTGLTGVSMQITPGTLIGTIVPVISFDGVNTLSTLFYNPQTGQTTPNFVFSSANGWLQLTIVCPPGCAKAGVYVDPYTSGSCTVSLVATAAGAHPVIANTPGVNVSNTPNVGITGTPNVAVTSGVPNVTSTATFNAAFSGPTVSMQGRAGASFTTTAGTLTGILTPYVSFDGGANWIPTRFVNVNDLTTTPTWSFANPSGAVQLLVLVPPGVTNVAVFASTYTSGSATGSLTATSGGTSAITTDPRAATSLNPSTGTPGAANRNVSATSTASASATSSSVTLIAAPGAGKSLELHGLTVTMTDTNNTTLTQAMQCQLQRSDTGTQIWQGNISAQGTTTTIASIVNTQVNSDFQGATLPPNVGVNLVVSNGLAVANLNYTTVS